MTRMLGFLHLDAGGRDGRRWPGTEGGGTYNGRMREFVTWLFGVGLIGNAMLFVPQAIAVWKKKSDEGISLITFAGFNILQLIGVVHGMYEHDPSLIVGLGASFLTCGTVTGLTLYYRAVRKRSVASEG